MVLVLLWLPASEVQSRLSIRAGHFAGYECRLPSLIASCQTAASCCWACAAEIVLCKLQDLLMLAAPPCPTQTEQAQCTEAVISDLHALLRQAHVLSRPDDLAAWAAPEFLKQGGQLQTQQPRPKHMASLVSWVMCASLRHCCTAEMVMSTS